MKPKTLIAVLLVWSFSFGVASVLVCRYGQKKSAADQARSAKPLAGWLVILPGHEAVIASGDLGGYVGRALFDELIARGAKVVSTEDATTVDPHGAGFQMNYFISWTSEFYGEDANSFDHPNWLNVELRMGAKHPVRIAVDRQDVGSVDSGDSPDQLRTKLAKLAAERAIAQIAKQ